MTLLKHAEDWLLKLKIYAQTYIHIYIYACVYPYIYTCRYIYICMFIHTHTYTHTRTRLARTSNNIIKTSGHYHRDCRLRKLAAGRPCPRNVTSASSTRHNLKHNPKNNLKHNPKNNPKNNLKNNLKNKLALRTANLQAVIDNPAISMTQQMSAGTSAAVTVLTDVDWADLLACWITDNIKLVLSAEDINEAKTHIFTCLRGKNGLSMQQKHDYNLETVRIFKAGGDISQRHMYMMYLSTTVRDVGVVSV